MSGFDLSSLLEFRPPEYLCEKCCAINQPAFDQRGSKTILTCEVCGVRYVATNEYEVWAIDEFLRRESGTGIRFRAPFKHGGTLARIARNLKLENEYFPHMRSLGELFLAAEQFIHFMSWGINQSFIGSLKLISHRVAVRGIVSNVNDNFTRSELLEFPRESPGFRCEIFDGHDAPHTKLIVVDGLVALAGSANLTVGSWRKIGHNRDRLTVETDLSRVAYEHNRYFAPLWGGRSRIGSQIRMECRGLP